MLAILGRKMGAPWTAAALEKGMEAYPGQPTIRDLELVYHYRAINRETKLVGVTGVGEREYLTTALLNGAFASLNLSIRCLPLQVGDVRLFRKVIEAVKLLGVVIEEEQQDALREVANCVDDSVSETTLNPGGMPVENSVDLLTQGENKQWLGRHTFGSGAAAALERVLESRGRKLNDSVVMMAGLNATARTMARAVKERGGKLVFASRDRDTAARFSRMFGGRQIQYEGIYSTLCDVIIVCADAPTSSATDLDPAEMHPGFLKAGMTVMDLTALPRKTALLREAELRFCAIVSPADLLIEQVRRQVQCLTGLDVPREPLESTLAQLLDEE
jgi:3-dehydroquinate dehydratase/shikimate dehydrogenase